MVVLAHCIGRSSHSENKKVKTDKRGKKVKTYKIIRHYENSDMVAEVIASGLSFAEAQEWTNNPETSSSTATHPHAITRTELYGNWFDAYTEE